MHHAVGNKVLLAAQGSCKAGGHICHDHIWKIYHSTTVASWPLQAQDKRRMVQRAQYGVGKNHHSTTVASWPLQAQDKRRMVQRVQYGVGRGCLDRPLLLVSLFLADRNSNS
jgi:hypothetical protein